VHQFFEFHWIVPDIFGNVSVVTFVGNWVFIFVRHNHRDVTVDVEDFRQQIGFLAGFGIEEVTVHQRLKIGLVFTGNELVEIGKPLSDGEIYNSNRYTLQAALAEVNHRLSFIKHAEDTEEATFSAIKEAFENTDVLLITGGISVGDYDYVKPALEKSGVAELFTESGRNPENLYSSGSLMTNLFLRYREIPPVINKTSVFSKASFIAEKVASSVSSACFINESR
jgi:molybdenum cofactor synthesis domain-containing protein